MRYSDYIASKLSIVPPTGIPVEVAQAGAERACLFDFQIALTRWALCRGRAAVFASTGLGKSRIQLVWCDVMAKRFDRPALIYAPIAVVEQTAEEGAAIGIPARVAAGDEDLGPGVNITNYEKAHRFTHSRIGAVAWDESSIFKSFNGATFNYMRDAYAATPYRLCLTATPSPNDYTELGTHAEILGICTRTEMLSEFFVHDGGDTQTWRLKGHARGQFWKFVASWGALVRSPADLGFEADAKAYSLPPLSVEYHTISTDEPAFANGRLYADAARGLMERRQARRDSMPERVRQCADMVASKPDEKWIIWCNLNDEQDEVCKALSDRGVTLVSIEGATPVDDRPGLEKQWRLGDVQVLVTKQRIYGWGANWQHCAEMAFVGIDDSWEAYHQAVRRIWRFGQKRPCHVHLFASEVEGNVARNLQRKERDAAVMSEELAREASEAVRASVVGQRRVTNAYVAPRIDVPEWMKGKTK